MTTNKITESAIEELAIELLEKQGYQYLYAPDIAPDGENPERESFEDVLLLERLRRAVGRINPTIPADAREDAIKQIQRLNSPELIANNEAFHRMLTEGIKVSYQKDRIDRGDIVWLVDFNNPENNEFLVTNQFTVIENNLNKRPDLIICARELMQKDTLRELAVVLFEKVKQNASIDWTIKENVRAKLRVIVKRTLRQYGYPPDMQALATETVLKQAELIADEMTNME